MDETTFTSNAGSSPNERDAQLKEENEILRMRIIAEFGGVPGELDNIPPEVANQFLKNVIAFEQQYANKDHQPVKVEVLLDNPVFQKETALNESDFRREWKRLMQLLEQKSICVNFIRKRDERFQYRFITEELFQHEMDAEMIPGMIWNFIYEEFHPDHEQEIKDRTMEFLDGWFERDVEKMKYALAMHFIQPDGKVLKQEELIDKVQQVFESYSSFEDDRYRILEAKFQVPGEDKMEHLGHSEGWVRYEATLESGERKLFEGPFKFYMARQFDWWDIFYFVMPGFESPKIG